MWRVTKPTPQRPLMPGAGLFESLPSLHDPALLAEVAHRTAAVLVRGAQNSDDEKVAERVTKLADEFGLDQLADLWSDSPADSLPGVLWRLYLLRSWVHAHAETVAREYAAGRRHAEVDAVVAGVADPPGPTEVRDMVDAVLRGVARRRLRHHLGPRVVVRPDRRDRPGPPRGRGSRRDQVGVPAARDGRPTADRCPRGACRKPVVMVTPAALGTKCGAFGAAATLSEASGRGSPGSHR